MKLWLEHQGELAEAQLRLDGSSAQIELGGETLTADVEWIDDRFVSIIINGRSYEILSETAQNEITLTVSGQRLTRRFSRRPPRRLTVAAAGSGAQSLKSPMPGKVKELLVAEGDSVTSGQGIIIVEAMKMENELRATGDGIVKRIHTEAGRIVEGGTLLVEIGPCS